MELVSCKRCGAVGVPLPAGSLAPRALTCTACGVAQPVSDYLAGGELMARMATAAMRNRAELEAARREGVRCGACGAMARLPEDISVPSFACDYCRATLMTSSYVAPELVMGMGIRATIDAARQASARQSRTVAIALGVGIPLVIVVAVVAAMLARAP